jgi:hypothetical protein
MCSLFPWQHGISYLFLPHLLPFMMIADVFGFFILEKHDLSEQKFSVSHAPLSVPL